MRGEAVRSGGAEVTTVVFWRCRTASEKLAALWGHVSSSLGLLFLLPCCDTCRRRGKCKLFAAIN